MFDFKKHSLKIFAFFIALATIVLSIFSIIALSPKSNSNPKNKCVDQFTYNFIDENYGNGRPLNRTSIPNYEICNLSENTTELLSKLNLNDTNDCKNVKIEDYETGYVSFTENMDNHPATLPLMGVNNATDLNCIVKQIFNDFICTKQDYFYPKNIMALKLDGLNYIHLNMEKINDRFILECAYKTSYLGDRTDSIVIKKKLLLDIKKKLIEMKKTISDDTFDDQIDNLNKLKCDNIKLNFQDKITDDNFYISVLFYYIGIYFDFMGKELNFEGLELIYLKGPKEVKCTTLVKFDDFNKLVDFLSYQRQINNYRVHMKVNHLDKSNKKNVMSHIDGLMSFLNCIKE